MDEQPEPESSMFTDDPATMDLAAKVDQAWRDFQDALAAALPALPESVAALDLTLDPTAAEHGDAFYTVTVDVSERGQLRAYAVSNRMLPREHQLSLKRLGELWRSAGRRPVWCPTPGNGRSRPAGDGDCAPREDHHQDAA